MAIVVDAMHKGRSYQIEQSQRRASITWIVYDQARPTAVLLNEEKVLSAVFTATGIRKNSQHPDYPDLRAENATVDFSDETDSIWLATWHFNPASPQTGPVVPPDEDEIGFIDWGSDTTARFIDTFRDWSTLQGIAVLAAAEGQPARTDIGGLPIDSRGEPVSMALRTQSLNVPHVIQGFPQFAVYRAATGRRNDGEFLGSPPGFVVYLGVSTARLGASKYRVTHRFVWDEYAHLRQIPELDDDDRPVTGSSYEYPAGTQWQSLACTSVFYVQPFPKLADFNALDIPGDLP